MDISEERALDKIHRLAVNVTLAGEALNDALLELATSDLWESITYQSLASALGTSRQAAAERTARLLRAHLYAVDPKRVVDALNDSLGTYNDS